MILKKTRLIASILAMAIFLCSCGAKPIFKKEGEDYELKGLTDEKLEEDQYYVKDNTTFYLAHDIEGNKLGNNKTTDIKRVAWTMQDESLVPTMYSDGLIAYKSRSAAVSNINIERFKDIGYSIGLYNAEVDMDGYIKFKYSSSVVKDSDLYTQLEEYKSYDLRIVTINGEFVKDNLDLSGCIEGLEHDKTYTIEFYAGTQFLSIDVKADVKFYTSYEMYYVDSSADTTNGYVAIEMPDDAKSGYYYVNGKGFFRYYNSLKSEVDKDQDMNEAYYNNAAEQISANSQAYVIGVEQTTKDISFVISYETDVYKDEDVLAYLTAPNNECYQMIPVDGYATLALDEAIAGRWTINIIPKDLVITDVTTESNAIADDATKETFNYTFEEETNLKITIPYTGEGEVWGTVTSLSDNTAYEFVKDKQQIICTISYVAAGDYQIDIYHYADTEIGEPDISYNEEAEDEDVIIVESD